MLDTEGIGEITEIGNPHKNDNSGATFNSQISAVFHHPKHPGYKTFNIAPLVGGRLTNAKGSVKTPYGKIVSDWKIEGDTFKIKIQVPVSATCHLILPNGEEKELGSGEYEFKSCRK
jgi:alpha-L-rhamnosidase